MLNVQTTQPKEISVDEKKLKKDILRYIGPKGFDINVLSPVMVDYLVKSGLVTEVKDLYHLTVKDLAKVRWVGRSKAEEFIDVLHIKKKVNLENFLYALNIPKVREDNCVALARKFKTIGQIMNVQEEDLEDVPTFGIVARRSIVEFFEDDHCVEGVEALRGIGVTWNGEIVKPLEFA